MIQLCRSDAIRLLEKLQNDSDYLEPGDLQNFKSMTNEQFCEEFCLSGLFEDHYPNFQENDFEVIN